MSIIITLILLGAFYLALGVFSVVLLREREIKAASRSLILSFIPLLLFLLWTYLDFNLKQEISMALNILVFGVLFLLLLPIKGKKQKRNDSPASQLDERNIMFSRYELKPDTEKFEGYYKSNPNHKEPDDKFREKAGLLRAGSAKYDPVMFASSDASFETVDQLGGLVNGEVNTTKVITNPKDITNYVTNWTKHLGAVDVGITELKDYHTYTVAGRGERYGDKINLDHKYAIAFTVEMDVDMVNAGPDAPIVMESAKQYLNAGAIACQLALFIRKLGYPARAHIDANYQVICPLVAKDAGLGEIGRMGLLITDNLGPRVRIGVVTTDLELMISEKTEDDTVIEFCNLCKKCSDVCPSRAIPDDERKEINGALRWQISQENCFTYWCTVGTDCGRCVSVCPYSHPNNLLHNIVRYGIKHSFIFRRFAAMLDDLFYGKKPAPAEPLKWMKIKSS